MQLTDILSYFIFTVTIATSLAQQDDHRHELSEAKSKSEKRVSKRDAAIFIDSFPIEPIYSHRPKIIYRRISKQRYKSPKPKYGPPMYRSKPRKPVKKYKNVKPRYGPPSYKRRPTKPKYGPPKLKYKPVYGPPIKVPQSYYAQEPTSFGEPPADLEYPSKQNFGEPPLDSYGSPINGDVVNPYIPDQFSPSSYSDPSATDNLGTNLGQDWQNFQDQNFDNNVAYSKIEPTYSKPDVDIIYSMKRPTFAKLYDSDDMIYSKKRPMFTKSNPFSSGDVTYTKKRFKLGKPEHFDSDDITHTKRPIFVTPETYDPDEDFDSSSNTHISKNSENIDESHKIKRRPYYSGETIKTKTRKPQPTLEPDDDVLVGGRYAEPPARFVPKYQQTFSLHSEDDDFAPLKGFVDPDIAISATMSPYVNYKHSNVAFSPQNLNDAFSIVDKK